MRNQYVGKNIAELNATIDSVTARIDSAGVVIARELREAPAMGVPYFVMRRDRPGAPSRKVVRHDVTMSRPLDVDSVFNRGGYYPRASIVQSALSKAKRKKTEYEFGALRARKISRLSSPRHRASEEVHPVGGLPDILLYRRTVRSHYPQGRTRNAYSHQCVPVHILLYNRQLRFKTSGEGRLCGRACGSVPQLSFRWAFS